MAIVKKMTTKTILKGAPDKGVLKDSNGEPVYLATVFGDARLRKPDNSDYGPYVKFSGSFRAINHESGEEIRSRVLILPAVAEGIIDEILAQEEINSVEFAIKLGIVESATPIGYEWVVEPLEGMSAENDPLAHLESRLRDKNLLPAPKAEAEPETVIDENGNPPTRATPPKKKAAARK